VGTYTSSTGQSVVSRTAIDARGYVYLTGSYSGTVQFGSFTLAGGATTHGFVAKLDGAGAYQWVATTDGLGNSYCGGLAVDASGQVSITGSFYGASVTLGGATLANTSTAPNFSSDAFVARLDANGQWLWGLPVGGTGGEGLGQLVLDAAGNSYVIGGFSGSNSTFGTITLPNSGSSGTYELCVAKLSAQGTWLWARSGGGSNQDGGSALAVDAGGNVYLAGFSQAGPATFGPFALPSTTSANDDILVAKLDASGTWQWVRRVGGSGIDDGNGLTLDAAGNAYVTGYFRSATALFGTLLLANSSGPADSGDVFVAKIDPAGTWQWAVQGGAAAATPATAWP